MGELWIPPSARPQQRWCVCCDERAGETSLTFVAGGMPGVPPTQAVKAILCARCRAGEDYGNGNIPQRRHSAGWCTLCGRDGGPVWKCAMRSHVANRHPELMEKLVNDPYDDIAEVPQPEYLGRVEWEQRPGDSPKRIF